MVSTVLETGLMTLEEFNERQGTEGPFEILDGEVVPKMPNVARHTLTMRTLYRALLPYDLNGSLVVFLEATFVLLVETHWVKGSRIPDLMAYDPARLQAYYESMPNWEDMPFAIIPDLVIEVVSPTDKYSDIDARVTRYLEDGVKLIWVVDPQTRKAVVHPGGGEQPVHLAIGDSLTGGSVIPDFVLPLADLFASPLASP